MWVHHSFFSFLIFILWTFQVSNLLIEAHIWWWCKYFPFLYRQTHRPCVCVRLRSLCLLRNAHRMLAFFVVAVFIIFILHLADLNRIAQQNLVGWRKEMCRKRTCENKCGERMKRKKNKREWRICAIVHRYCFSFLNLVYTERKNRALTQLPTHHTHSFERKRKREKRLCYLLDSKLVYCTLQHFVCVCGRYNKCENITWFGAVLAPKK